MTETDYSCLPGLEVELTDDRVLHVVLSNGPMNSMDFDLHHSLAEMFSLVDSDEDVNAVLLTGKGRTFSAGGDFELVERLLGDYEFRTRMWKDARNLVKNMIDCATPVVAGVRGAAAGAGLAVALLSDVSVVAKEAKLVDGHTTLGIAADDHAVAIWPLLCGMAKAKYYLMMNEPISGEVAEEIGLVTKAVPSGEVEATAEEIAVRFAASAPGAIRWTKVALNNWLLMAWPAFEASLALGIVGLSGPEAREGLSALKERRPPNFEPRSPV